MSTAASTRRPRADAQRNRQRIIEAATEVFREEGLGASTATISERAGVGSGTLFRNFAAKTDLILAVIELHMERWFESAQTAADAEDPAAAFDQFFVDAVQFGIDNRGMLQAANQALLEDGLECERSERAMEATELLVANAARAGAISGDLDAQDILALCFGIAEAVEMRVAKSDESIESVTRRLTAIVLAGMRP